jgi:hypothetical protein
MLFLDYHSKVYIDDKPSYPRASLEKDQQQLAASASMLLLNYHSKVHVDDPICHDTLKHG